MFAMILQRLRGADIWAILLADHGVPPDRRPAADPAMQQQNIFFTMARKTLKSLSSAALPDVDSACTVPADDGTSAASNNANASSPTFSSSARRIRQFTGARNGTVPPDQATGRVKRRQIHFLNCCADRTLSSASFIARLKVGSTYRPLSGKTVQRQFPADESHQQTKSLRLPDVLAGRRSRSAAIATAFAVAANEGENFVIQRIACQNILPGGNRR